MITNKEIRALLEGLSSEAYQIDPEYGLPDADKHTWMTDRVRGLLKKHGVDLEPEFTELSAHEVNALVPGTILWINCPDLRTAHGTNEFVFYERANKPNHAWVFNSGDWDFPAKCPFGGASAILLPVCELGRFGE